MENNEKKNRSFLIIGGVNPPKPDTDLPDDDSDLDPSDENYYILKAFRRNLREKN